MNRLRRLIHVPDELNVMAELCVQLAGAFPGGVFPAPIDTIQHVLNESGVPVHPHEHIEQA
jgi:hypothetical protein